MLLGGGTEKSPLVFTPKSSSAFSKVLTGQDQGIEEAILFPA
jgi:hypothetical protein